MPDLAWTPEVQRETAHLYEKVKSVIPPVEWPFHAPYVKAINELKKQRNAVLLAHNYQTPEIYNCVADFVGDSLQLAREATKTKAALLQLANTRLKFGLPLVIDLTLFNPLVALLASVNVRVVGLPLLAVKVMLPFS